MKPEELSKIRRFVDRDGWIHSEHMVRNRWRELDMGHPDNIERVRQLIAEAKREACAIRVQAEEIERVMDKEGTI